MKTFILTMVGLVTLVMFAVSLLAQTTNELPVRVVSGHWVRVGQTDTNDLPPGFKLQFEAWNGYRVVDPYGNVGTLHFDTAKEAVEHAILVNQNFIFNVPQPVDPPPAKLDINAAASQQFAMRSPIAVGLDLYDSFSPCGDADIKCWHVPEVLTNWVDVKEDGTNMLQAGVITSNYLLLAQWRETPIHTNVLFTSNLVLQSLPMRVVPKPATVYAGSNLWWNGGTTLTPWVTTNHINLGTLIISNNAL